MSTSLQDAIIRASQLKDFGNHATYGAIMANKRQRNQYLRKHRLGKFAKGKK